MYIDQAIRWRLIESHLPPPPHSIFEVGCGSGDFLRHLKVKGYLVRGCEPSSDAVSKKAGETDLVMQASGTAIPLPDNFVDITISSDVLEHVEPDDRKKFVAEMVRITKPGGSIVCTVWVRPTFAFRIMGCVYLLRWGKLPAWYTEHLMIRPPALTEIAALLRDGTEVQKIQPYHSAVGHIVAAFQHAFFRYNSRACRFTTAFAGLVSVLDFLGASGSCLYVAKKPSA